MLAKSKYLTLNVYFIYLHILQMSKFEPLKYLEARIKNRIKNLEITEIAQHFNNPHLEIEMCEAILEVFSIVKSIEETRWGRAPLENSNKNLSWIVSSKINPVLLKTNDLSGTAISTYSPVNLTIKSKKYDIENTALFLQKYLYLGESEKSALDFLAESLLILVVHYSPAEKNHRKTGNQPYCLYCYRECYQLGSDTCDMHNGVNRTKGKRFFKRYIEMKKAIDLYEKENKLDYLNRFNKIALKKLNDEKICAWAEASDKRAWVSQVLLALNICDKWKIDYKADELLKKSQKDVITDFPSWPSTLNGTMFRYQAYALAKLRRPTSKMIKKLHLVWGGQKVIDVAHQSKVQRSGLQRAVIDWRNRIGDLRSQEVPDVLIKAALGLEFLPNRNIGGAANKKSPQRF